VVVALVVALPWGGTWVLHTAGAPEWAMASGGAAVVLSLGITVLLLRARLVAVTVRGTSMEPTYRDGDRVLVRRASAFTPGQVVVVERPGTGRAWMIKRVVAVPGDPVPRQRVPALASEPAELVPRGRLVLLGDNAGASFDSRQLGYFPAERVLGAVLRPLRGDRAGGAPHF
jgi:signal peptidase I